MAMSECLGCHEFGNFTTCPKCGSSYRVVFDEEERSTIEETFYSEKEEEE